MRATSSGTPIRPIGNLGKRCSRIPSVIHVESVGPGFTALTVIPNDASSADKDRVKAEIAPFVAA